MDDLQVVAKKVPQDLKRIGQNHCKKSSFGGEEQLFVVVLHLNRAQHPWIRNCRRLTSLLGIKANELVSEFRVKPDAVRAIIAYEVWIVSVLAVAEARVGSDLASWLGLAHRIAPVVCDVALALFVVSECTLPAGKVLACQRLKTVHLWLWAREEIQVAVVIVEEVEVELVLLLARELREEGLVACVVALESKSNDTARSNTAQLSLASDAF